MSFVSNFYRATPQILVEYRTPQYDIINNSANYTMTPSKKYVYKGLDGDMYFIYGPKSFSESNSVSLTDSDSGSVKKNQSLYMKYAVEGGGSYSHINMCAEGGLTDIE